MNKDKLKGKVVRKYITDAHNYRAILEFTDGTFLHLEPTSDSIMGNKTWLSITATLVEDE